MASSNNESWRQQLFGPQVPVSLPETNPSSLPVLAQRGLQHVSCCPASCPGLPGGSCPAPFLPLDEPLACDKALMAAGAFPSETRPQLWPRTAPGGFSVGVSGGAADPSALMYRQDSSPPRATLRRHGPLSLHGGEGPGGKAWAQRPGARTGWPSHRGGTGSTGAPLCAADPSLREPANRDPPPAAILRLPAPRLHFP